MERPNFGNDAVEYYRGDYYDNYEISSAKERAFESGCDAVWDKYVDPLIKENETLKQQLKVAEKALQDISSFEGYRSTWPQPHAARGVIEMKRIAWNGLMTNINIKKGEKNLDKNHRK